jgi:F0F1-type ATP synthase membrane subunit c/vacuolar-type H+-ATPase subunit K
MQQPPDATAFNRIVKLLYFALFASVGLYWFITGFIPVDPELTPPPLIAQVLTFLAAGVAVAVAFLRFNRIPHAQSRLLTDPNALNQLRVLYIVCFALAESVAVYGLVFYLLGGPRNDAAWFFLGSAALFALCYPKSLEPPPGLS